jgi:transposase
MSQKYVLGIDVSKAELVIFDTATKKHFSVANNAAALTKACLANHWSSQSHIAGLESTGDYGLAAMKTLVELGFTVRLLNPILTQSGIKRTVRGTKTDTTDSELIAELTAKGEGHEVNKNSLNIEKKATLRLERKLTLIGGNLKKLKKSINQKQAIGVSLTTAETELGTLIDQIDIARENLWQTLGSQEFTNHLNRQEQIISSHIGCGTKLSTIISEEAGDIKRFPSARQLVAFAGIDPKVKQSGTMDIRGRMTKRGNNNLRHALYLAAQIASLHDPELKAYYQKKRSEGKHHTVAVCAVARKMCERIYSTVVHDRLYEKREPIVKEQS